MKPYYSEPGVDLYHGKVEELLPLLGVTADLILADPPYVETSLKWDVWPPGWPALAATAGRALWCFGSLRMFMDRRAEFDRWTYSQDIIWEKHNGSSLANDRFRRVHEVAAFWYRGDWATTYHEAPTTPDATARQVRRKQRPAHWGDIGAHSYASEDGGPRLMRSVIYARSEHGRALSKTQKPTGVVEPLIQYACRPGGTVLSLFTGSGTDLLAARALGHPVIGIEDDEEQCEAAAGRLAQGVLTIEATP